MDFVLSSKAARLHYGGSKKTLFAGNDGLGPNEKDDCLVMTTSAENPRRTTMIEKTG